MTIADTFFTQYKDLFPFSQATVLMTWTPSVSLKAASHPDSARDTGPERVDSFLGSTRVAPLRTGTLTPTTSHAIAPADLGATRVDSIMAPALLPSPFLPVWPPRLAMVEAREPEPSQATAPPGRPLPTMLGLDLMRPPTSSVYLVAPTSWVLLT